MRPSLSAAPDHNRTAAASTTPRCRGKSKPLCMGGLSDGHTRMHEIIGTLSQREIVLPALGLERAVA